MITVGLDFGTHQTKVCYERVEAGTAFYEVFPFRTVDGSRAPTLPSFIRIREDNTLRYGHEAMADGARGRAVTYFKQVVFSWTISEARRVEAEKWAVLYLAFVIFKLDALFRDEQYRVHMGMPTDADPSHYAFCKGQAIKVLGAAMLMARNVFKRDLVAYHKMPYERLVDLVTKCLAAVPANVVAARMMFPIFVFPEAYVALIPLIKAGRLPSIGPNLFVDIGGGTVDISFFTNQMDRVAGVNRPYLYYYCSIPYGLNMIAGQDPEHCHNVEVGVGQITRQRVDLFREKMISTVDTMMEVLKQQYKDMGRTNVMPFTNLCGQILDGRPICYSGGGSMFHGLRLPLSNARVGANYNFTQVTSVSALIDHSKLYVNNMMFHVLATAFALAHQSLVSVRSGEEPDSIKLVSLDKLFQGIRNPVTPVSAMRNKWDRPRRWNW